MNKLVAFDSSHLQSFRIFADLNVDRDDSSRLILVFTAQDVLSEVDLINEDINRFSHEMERKDELWRMTCFEMFLNPAGQKQYFEFNFSLEGAWNAYHFAGYRFPQPPQVTTDFEVEQLNWKHKQLEVVLKNKTKFRKFNVGLCAVIQNKKNQVSYFALKHEGGKPDFHSASGFTLQRGSDGFSIGS